MSLVFPGDDDDRDKIARDTRLYPNVLGLNMTTAITCSPSELHSSFNTDDNKYVEGMFLLLCSTQTDNVYHTVNTTVEQNVKSQDCHCRGLRIPSKYSPLKMMHF